MLAIVLIISALNTLLQLVAVYQRHQTLELQKRNGGAS
jgi:hypothetical protein